MLNINNFFYFIVLILQLNISNGSFIDFTKCKWNPNPVVSESPSATCVSGQISDCDCDFQSVNGAVKTFFSPLLADLTSRTYFRYFLVDLDRRCPFWNADTQCFIESCSVYSCSEDEIPDSWKSSSPSTITASSSSSSGSSQSNNLYGWVNGDIRDKDKEQLSFLERVFHGNGDKKKKSTKNSGGGSSSSHKDNNWIDMPEREEEVDSGEYVNLLDNPEQYTGYSGPPAQRVWSSIQQENCFGGQNDICTEKRVFYRLMSGLQASISTHIARNYYFPIGIWGPNYELFSKAVGSHIDRINNLYFTFLFVLRSVVKLKDSLYKYDLNTGNSTDDEQVRVLLQELISARIEHTILNTIRTIGNSPQEILISSQIMEDLITPSLPIHSSSSSSSSTSPSSSTSTTTTNTVSSTSSLPSYSHSNSSIDKCRKGFDESVLFQVSQEGSGNSGNRIIQTYDDSWTSQQEKEIMKEEFRLKFRNISRIMDCVTCEKCRLWGKLQILGLGTAIKILLSTEEDLIKRVILSKQELVALINVLHQLTKSVKFASDVLSAKNSVTDRGSSGSSSSSSSSSSSGILGTSSLSAHTTSTVPIEMTSLILVVLFVIGTIITVFYLTPHIRQNQKK